MIKQIQKIILSGILCVGFLAPMFSLPVFADGGDMTSPGFTFDVNNLSPTENKYENGTKINLKDILAKIGTMLLIVIPMLAVLFIVI
jgi:hypothetical protein